MIIGDVEMGPGSSVWFGCVLRGDLALIWIGVRTNVQDVTVIHVNVGTAAIIGNDVTIGHRAIVHACTLEDRNRGRPGCRAEGGPGQAAPDGAVVGDP